LAPSTTRIEDSHEEVVPKVEYGSRAGCGGPACGDVMPTELNIIDRNDTLLATTKQKPPLLDGLVSATATGGCTGLLASSFVGKPELVALVCLTSSVAFFYALRTRRFELRITRLEFKSRGRLGDSLASTRTVCASDIQWLEHQENTTGLDTAHHPRGLYAVLRHRSVCLLPDVDEQQSASIIERIHDKYPEFRAQWSGQSPFGRHFTSLGLDEPS
jgi:hypothetical protein